MSVEREPARPLGNTQDGKGSKEIHSPAGRLDAAEPAARGEDLNVADFAAVMLRALIDMAARSHRRQADLLAALRGADLPADPVRVRAALRLLLLQGCVANLVPLSDGAVLLTVTQQAMQQSGPVPHWLSLDELDGTSVAETAPVA